MRVGFFFVELTASLFGWFEREFRRTDSELESTVKARVKQEVHSGIILYMRVYVYIFIYFIYMYILRNLKLQLVKFKNF